MSEEAELMIKNAVAEAMKSQPVLIDKAVTSAFEGLKIPTSEEILTECKDGICKIVEESFEGLITKAPKGSTSTKALIYDCPDCDATFTKAGSFLKHIANESLGRIMSDNLMECKDGICKMVEEHVETTYNVMKKGEETPPPEEEEPGLYSLEDEPEEEG